MGINLIIKHIMEKKVKNTNYVSPSVEAVELVLEGSILVNSPGGEAGGDAGGVGGGWDE